MALGVWGRPRGGLRPRTPSVGLSSWATATSTRRRGTGTRRASARASVQSGLDRDDVFITTKFYPGSKDPVPEIEKSLQRLGLEYVDLYLVHWPKADQPGPGLAWSGRRILAMRCSIGVSGIST